MIKRASVVVLSLGLATSSIASKVQRDFAGIWSAREKEYAAGEQNAQQAMKDVTLHFVDTFNTGGPTLVADFQSMLGVTFNSAQATARLRLLKEFEAFMATKPSAAGAEAWMQGKMAEMQPAVPGVQAEDARLAKVKVGVDEPAQQWVKEKTNAASMSGMVTGLLNELTLINQNLQSYYQGLGVEQAQAAQTRRAILGGLAAGLAAAGSAAPPPPRNFSVTCTQTGPFTNCNGSH